MKYLLMMVMIATAPYAFADETMSTDAKPKQPVMASQECLHVEADTALLLDRDGKSLARYRAAELKDPATDRSVVVTRDASHVPAQKCVRLTRKAEQTPE
jgi:hypothetical protein